MRFFRHALRAVLVVLLVAASTAPAHALTSYRLTAGEAALVQRAHAEGLVRVLVTTEGAPAQTVLLEQLRRQGADVLHRYRLLPVLLVKADAAVLRALALDPRVVSIEADDPERPSLGDTVPLINADDVHAQGYTGTGTAVSVLDTGIDRDHPFFAGKIVDEACYSNAAGDGGGTTLCPGGVTSLTGAGAADAETGACLDGTVNICDHGSHVAGIAAGEGTAVAGAPGDGVAPGAGIVAMQVFTRFDSATDCSPLPAPCVSSFPSDQLLALERSLATAAANDIVAVNMSLGGGNFSSDCDGDNGGRKAAIDALLGAGVATVISAGNNGMLNAVGRPGCISTAITVGSTDNDDTVSSFSNRGPLLDLLAPGNGVDSAVPDDTWANLPGTSMAAPHVAGAIAVLRGLYPSASVATVLGWLRDNGVDITYSTGGTSTATTPRIDLLASLQPVVTASSALVQVDEGSTAENTGTFADPNGDPVTLAASTGTVSGTATGTWSWTYTPLDDAAPVGDQVVTITATDSTGFVGTTSFQLDVVNVAPQVDISLLQETVFAEGDVAPVGATFTDPGSLDTYTAQIDWGHPDLGSTPAATDLHADGPPGQDGGTAQGSTTYGDNGSFLATVTVTDDDGGTGSASVWLTVGNLDPTGEIDPAGTVLVGGTPTLLGEAGAPVDLLGRSDDVGSDDLTFSWDFDDGQLASSTSRVDPLVDDALPSPSVHPRTGVTDLQSHAYTDACLYEATLAVTDDDGGAAPQQSVQVLVQGSAVRSESAGWWHGQYDHEGAGSVFTTDTLLCYLEVARSGSAVFDESRPLSSIAQAHDVMHKDDMLSTPQEKLDKALLTAWLNFANGGFAFDEPVVDTDRDGTRDLSFVDAITAAEAVRNDALSTPADLEAQRKVVHEINRYGK